MVSDTLSDVLTRIRNAQRAGHASVTMPLSNATTAVLQVLKREGFIQDFKQTEVSKEQAAKSKTKQFPKYNVVLKYYQNGDPLIRLAKRVSTPGRRIYSSVKGLPKVLCGLGISIVSTSQGMLSDREARKLGIGGEVVATIG